MKIIYTILLVVFTCTKVFAVLTTSSDVMIPEREIKKLQQHILSIGFDHDKEKFLRSISKLEYIFKNFKLSEKTSKLNGFSVFDWGSKMKILQERNALTDNAFNISKKNQFIQNMTAELLVKHNDLKGQLLKSLKHENKRISNIVWHPSKTQIASYSSNRSVNVWDVKTSACLHSLKNNDEISNVAWHPSGDILALGCKTGAIYIWNLTSNVVSTFPQVHSDSIINIAWNKSGFLLASSSSGNDVCIWNHKNYECLYQLEHDNNITDIDWHPSGKYLASSSEGRNLFVWDMDTGKCLHDFYHNMIDSIYRIAWSPIDNCIAIASKTGSISMWRPEDNKIIFTRQAHKDKIHKISWHPSGTNIASCSKDGTFGVWNAITGYCIYSNNSNSDESFENHFDDYDSDHVKCNIFNNDLHFHRINSYSNTGKVLDIGWNSSGSLLASCNNNNTISIWDFHTGKLSQIIKNIINMTDFVEITQIKWHPLEAIIASCSDLHYQESLSIWDPYAISQALFYECIKSLQELCLDGINKQSSKLIEKSDQHLTENKIALNFTWNEMNAFTKKVENANNIESWNKKAQELNKKGLISSSVKINSRDNFFIQRVVAETLACKKQLLVNKSPLHIIGANKIKQKNKKLEVQWHPSKISLVCLEEGSNLMYFWVPGMNATTINTGDILPYNNFTWHPEKLFFCLSSDSGIIFICDFDYKENKLIIKSEINLPLHRLYYSKYKCTWNPQGKYLAIYTASKQSITIWNVEDNKPVTGINIENLQRQRYIFNVLWKPSGDMLFINSNFAIGNAVDIWDACTRTFAYSIKYYSFTSHNLISPINHVSWNPSGPFIAVLFSNNAIEICNVSTGLSTRTYCNNYPTNLKKDSLLQWSPDGKYLAAKLSANIITIFELDTIKGSCKINSKIKLAHYYKHKIVTVNSINWSALGTSLACFCSKTRGSGMKGAYLFIWDIGQNKCLQNIKLSGSIEPKTFSWSKSGLYFSITYDKERLVRIWDRYGIPKNKF